MTYYYRDQISIDLMSAVQHYWEQVGVKCEPRLITGNLLEIIYEQVAYDMLYGAVSAMDVFEIYAIYHSSKKNNVWKHKDPRVDNLIDTAMQQPDDNKRRDLLFELQRLDHEELLWRLPLWAPKNFIYESKRIKRPAIYGNLWFEHKLDLHLWEIVD